MLNVKVTVELGVFYPAKKFWQDIEFNHMLEDAGLVVLKVRTLMHGAASQLRVNNQVTPIPSNSPPLACRAQPR